MEQIRECRTVATQSTWRAIERASHRARGSRCKSKYLTLHHDIGRAKVSLSPACPARRAWLLGRAHRSDQSVRCVHTAHALALLQARPTAPCQQQVSSTDSRTAGATCTYSVLYLSPFTYRSALFASNRSFHCARVTCLHIAARMELERDGGPATISLCI